jgi:hypothetical protein
MGAAAVPIALAVTTAATGYQIYEGRKQAKEAKKQAEAIANRPVPIPTPPPTPTDTNAIETIAQRQRKLRSLQFGMASTITSKAGSSLAPLSTPAASPLKLKLGQ